MRRPNASKANHNSLKDSTSSKHSRWTEFYNILSTDESFRQNIKTFVELPESEREGKIANLRTNEEKATNAERGILNVDSKLWKFLNRSQKILFSIKAWDNYRKVLTKSSKGLSGIDSEFNFWDKIKAELKIVLTDVNAISKLTEKEEPEISILARNISHGLEELWMLAYGKREGLYVLGSDSAYDRILHSVRSDFERIRNYKIKDHKIETQVKKIIEHAYADFIRLYGGEGIAIL